jgi:hypothetical protein
MQATTRHTFRSAAVWALIIITAGAVHAQGVARPPKLGTAQPERPTVSTHAGTVSSGWFEIETGLELDDGHDPDHNAAGVFAAKLGLAENVQLSMLATVVKPSDNTGGFGDLTFGVKTRLLNDNPILGDFAVQPNLKIPTGKVGRGSGTGTTDGTLLFISSRDVYGLDLDINLAYTFRGGSGLRAPRDSWLWAASLGGDLPHGWGWAAEFFGVPGTNGAQGAPPLVAFLAGPTLTITESLVFDIGVILPVAGPQPHAFYTGLTYNVGRIWGEREKKVVK